MKILFLMILIGYSLISIGQNKENFIPTKVQDAFNKKYDQAQDVDWDSNGKDQYEVEFELNDMEYDIVYNKEGKVLKEKREIEHSEMPNAVKNTIADLFKNRKIDEVVRMEKDTEVFYIVEFESTLVDDIVVLSKDGKVMDSQKAW